MWPTPTDIMYWKIWKYLYMFVCACVHVCVVACMCMCGDQVIPGHSLVGSGGQTPCSYLLTVLLNHDIGAVPTVVHWHCMYVYIRHCTHPGGTIAIATTRTGSHVRTCTSCRVAGEWRSVHTHTRARVCVCMRTCVFCCMHVHVW